MKRSASDTQQQITIPQNTLIDGTSNNKKPRFSQTNYGDVYTQYGIMSQYGASNPFTNGNGSSPYAAYGQSAASMYSMGYNNPQTMIASQCGAGYPQPFVNPVAATGYPNATNAIMSADTSRTIYLGNVSNDMDPHDILKQVHTGNIESFRIVPDKNCAFLSFVDPAAAQVFYQEHLTKKLIVNNTELRIGWGKASNLSTQLKLQLQGGATRNVYLGGLNENDNEDTIRAKLSCFGPIEQVRVIRDKNIGFVHFLNISSAIKCVAHLPSDPNWKNKKVNYGKDHCADLADQYGAAALSLQNSYAAVAAANGFGFDPYGYGIQAANPNSNLQRTLYFGNIHPEATCEDICNVIRGGNILQIRYLPDRHIAFVTFTDPNIALNVFNHTSTAGLNIRGRKIRVGWGKPSTISNQVAMAIQSGATRNIYIGGIDEKITIEKLREDFAEYGEIEMVNIFKEKNCAFVNFTSITSALTALNSIKSKPDYTELKINFGKDRCGNPWRPTNKTRENNIKKDENETSYSEENNVKTKKTEQNNNENCPNGNKNE